ncbi:muts domain V-domain-containing protein [Hyaloraphidium curvatum]|nr:muts domain V-domain-containing protein [Hyaloraphidium curvatum]
MYIDPSASVVTSSAAQIRDDASQASSENIAEQEDVREDDAVVLCLLHRKKRLGAAAFFPATRILYLMQECEETDKFAVAHQVILQLRPARIITSSRSDESFLDFLKNIEGNRAFIDVRPSTEFSFPNSLNRLLTVRILGNGFDVPSFEDRKEAETWLSGRIDLSTRNGETVTAAGALLAYLQRSLVAGDAPQQKTKKRGRKQLEEDEDDEGPSVPEVELEGVEEMALEAHLQISEDTLRALSIFIEDRHPSMHSSHRKEGLSLFGLLDTTLTPLGKRLLRSWFLKPSADPKVLQGRHDAVAMFVRPEYEHTADQIRTALKQVGNIRRVVQNLRVQPTSADFQSLLKFAYYAIRIRSTLRELPRGTTIEAIAKFQALCDAASLREIGSLINEICDFDASAEEGRFVVKPGVDEELDEMKRTYEGLNDFLTSVAREMSEIVDLPPGSTLNCIYFPQLGFLVTVPLQPTWRTAADFEIPGLQYQFCTANTVYYKSDRMRALDAELGDVHGLIADREIELMHQLSEAVLEHGGMMVRACEALAELDCLLAFAAAARKHGYARPAMTDANVLLVRGARHPLSEIVAETFVRNDVKFNEPGGGTRVLMLSGANCSGKSTYLKQIALIVFMAHIGSFVPADSAVVGFTDRILARIQTRETVSKHASAFMLDLVQANQALLFATPRSLVLLDEFGKGTATADGIALLCGIVEHFVDQGAACPKVAVATHFHEVFRNELLKPSSMLGYSVMEVMQGGSAEELTFLYRLAPGRATKSFGNYVAGLAGIPRRIVERSERVSESFARFEPVETVETEEDRARTEAAARIARRFGAMELEVFGSVGEFLDEVAREAEALGM